jgi:hypothetical protein
MSFSVIACFCSNTVFGAWKSLVSANDAITTDNKPDESVGEWSADRTTTYDFCPATNAQHHRTVKPQPPANRSFLLPLPGGDAPAKPKLSFLENTGKEAFACEAWCCQVAD